MENEYDTSTEDALRYSGYTEHTETSSGAADGATKGTGEETVAVVKRGRKGGKVKKTTVVKKKGKKQRQMTAVSETVLDSIPEVGVIQNDTLLPNGVSGDAAVSRLESKNKRPVRRNWQKKIDSERDINRLFRLIRNKKKIDTLRRAIQPKNGNNHASGSRKKVVDDIVTTEQPEIAYNKSVASIASKMKECTSMEDLGTLQECVAFHHRVFNEWQRNYLISKQFIEKELDAHGTVGAYEATGITGIKKFFVPTRESVLALLERHYRTLYHFNVEVGPQLHNTDEKFHMILKVSDLYAITRPETNKKTDSNSNNNSSSSSSSSSSNNTSTNTGIGETELIRRPDTFDGSTATCVLCNIPMINDAQHGESVCPSCGVVSRGTHNHVMSFQEQQQSSLRGAAPYERIAHVSFSSFYFLLYIFFASNNGRRGDIWLD